MLHFVSGTQGTDNVQTFTVTQVDSNTCSIQYSCNDEPFQYPSGSVEEATSWAEQYATFNKE